MKFTISVDPFLVIITILDNALNMSDLSSGAKKTIFKEIHQFYTFYRKMKPLLKRTTHEEP